MVEYSKKYFEGTDQISLVFNSNIERIDDYTIINLIYDGI